MLWGKNFDVILILILSIVLVVFSIIDNVTSSFLLYTYQERTTIAITLFVSLNLANLAIQFYILAVYFRFTTTNSQIEKKNTLYLYIMPFLFLYLIISLFMFHSIVFENRYFLSTFLASILSSLITSMTILSILIYRLLKWYNNNHNVFILFFVCAFLLFFVVVVLGLLSVVLELDKRTNLVNADSNPWNKTSLKKIVYLDYFKLFNLIMFSFTWIGTSLLLKNYVYNYLRNGRKLYWVIIFIPFLYYLLTSDFFTTYLNNLVNEFPFLFYLFTYFIGSAKQVSGIFFGLLFIVISKNALNVYLKKNLIILASGIIILYSSIQISIIQILPFPPFGLVTYSIMPLSAFMIYWGLYNSSKIIIQDSKFLDEIRSQLRFRSSSLIENIGSAERKIQLEDSVRHLINKVDNKSVGGGSNLTKSQVDDYINEVISEIQKEVKKE